VAQPHISQKTIHKYQEYFVSNHVLSTIEQTFDATDNPCHPPEGLTVSTVGEIRTS